MEELGSSSEILDSMIARKISHYLDNDGDRKPTPEPSFMEPGSHPLPPKFSWKKKSAAAVPRQKLEASVEANLGESKRP